ncbi:MAG TPA: 50S ribosomal protein L21 [Actinomycetota bacterium]|nr:50S ribosomal protein L21 [Actinomycetota bacterium]
MYAIIRAGGKQHKVAKGDIIEVEKIKSGGDSVEFTPLMIVDDKGKARLAPAELSKAKVTGKIVGESRGDKLKVFKYRNKTGYRRTAGHRQTYSQVEISAINVTGGRGSSKASSSKSSEEATDGS